MDAADAIRFKVKDALAPYIPSTNVYPYQRISPPQKHAQVYSGNRALGRFAGEYTEVVYINLFAAKESEVKAMEEALLFLENGYSTPQSGAAPTVGKWSYELQSSTTLEEADGTMHIAILLQATYLRQIAYTA